MEMYFIALVAPPGINGKILGWKEFMRDRYGCVTGLRSPGHITLVPPFWMDPSYQTMLESFLDRFSGKQPEFLLRLQNFSAFPPKVIFVNVIKSPDLMRLQAVIVREILAVKEFRASSDDRPFHPHLSIAARDLSKRAFRDAWAQFKNKTYDAEWLVNEVALLKHNKKNWDVVRTSRFKNNLS